MAISTDQVVENKLYVWTLKKHSNPKTSKYWADVVNGVVLFNPEYVAEQLENAKKKVEEVKKAWWNILVVMDKQLYRDDIKSLCEEKGYHYMNYNLPAWVFTNFETLKSRISQMNDLTSFVNSEDFAWLTKREKSATIKRLKKLETIYWWVKNLKSLPDLTIVVDGVFLSNFVNELEKMNMDSVVMSSSDFDRYRNEEWLVMANINSYKSLDFAMKYILS